MSGETTNHDADPENETTDALSKERKHDSGAADLVNKPFLISSSICTSDLGRRCH